MDITDYTSYDEVRLTVGLSSKELTDAELAEEIYANILSLGFNSVPVPSALGAGTYAAIFAALPAESSRTAVQQNFYDLTRMFATYTVAYEVCVSLSMRAPKMIADSKSSLTRFSAEATFRDVVSRISAKLAEIKASIEDLGSSTVTSLPYSYVIVPDVDVVTGE
jgi:hypothetical protein